MRGGVTDAGQTNKQTVKIELLSQWKLEAEFRNKRLDEGTNGPQFVHKYSDHERPAPSEHASL